MTKPAYQYFGAKQEIAQELIYPNLPENHTTFVDCCGGSGAVLLGLPKSWPVEVFNDVDEAIVTFFSVARSRPEELALQLLLTPYARREFDDHKHDENEAGIDEIEKARRFVTVARMSINGIWGRSWSRVIAHSRRGMSSSVSRWLHLPEDVLAVCERFAQVQIECLDVCDLIREYARPDTFFYIDPPYPSEVASPGYRVGMSDEQHRDLMKTILAHPEASYMVSSYRNSIYDDALQGFRIVSNAVKCRSNVTTSGKVSSRPKRIETVWMNY